MKPLAHLSDDEFSHLVQRALRALPDAPPALQQAAIGLWPASGPGAAFKALAQGVVAHIAAVLSFDSWAAPVVAGGMRSLRSPTRHLLFSAQGRDIDLRITPAADAFLLAGQILGPDEAGAVELAPQGAAGAEGAAAHVAGLDAMGEFRIEGVRRGTYVFTLRMGGDEIVLPPVEVGEPSN
jgi:hypothetical protein